MSLDDSRGDEVLGQGIAFPLQLYGGRLGMSAYDRHVEQSIRLVLGTALGERNMRPEFGAGLEQLAFEPINAATASYVRHQVREALGRFEPRIEVLDVSVTPELDSGVLQINLQYRLKRSDSVFNMVYPFYVERGER